MKRTCTMIIRTSCFALALLSTSLTPSLLADDAPTKLVAGSKLDPFGLKQPALILGAPPRADLALRIDHTLPGHIGIFRMCGQGSQSITNQLARDSADNSRDLAV